MKQFVIKESQAKLLREFMQPNFSFKDLDSFIEDDMKYEYCKHYLGDEIGSGLGRYVFDLTDDMVLKLQKNKYATPQNKNEWEVYQEYGKQFDFVMKVYGHADDFSWIVCERVVPFRNIDAEALLGIPATTEDFFMRYPSVDARSKEQQQLKQDLIDFDAYKTDAYPQRVTNILSLDKFIRFCRAEAMGLSHNFIGYEKLITDNPNSTASKWFKQIYDYFKVFKGKSDLHKDNLGVAMRNGQPTLIVIDLGFEGKW